MTNKIALIGECMVELKSRPDGLLERNFGGDTLNTAIYLARLSNQDSLSVSYVTALGQDRFGDEMLHAWQQENINTSLIKQLPDKSTGLYMVDTDPQGERTFSYWRNDSAAKYWLDTDADQYVQNQLETFDWIYLSGISLAILPVSTRQTFIALLKRAKQRGAKIIFDNNYRPRLWESVAAAQDAYQQVLSLTDIAMLTFDDEQALWAEQTEQQTIARTQGYGVPEIIVKRGALPCFIATASGNSFSEVAAQTISADRICDTTAAGDSFSAGYLAARLNGASPENSAHNGHLMASTVIQYPGAIIPLAAMPKLNKKEPL